ncbi:hypothetical protein HPULCUR_010195 [Helicostylum pulchrum]|uniref:Uncharacterized protein n=1 Tax=Helicostylum pulchrum TaxID=562976 RepID=A0ABP9YCL3_9FUNG
MDDNQPVTGVQQQQEEYLDQSPPLEPVSSTDLDKTMTEVEQAPLLSAIDDG